MEQHGRTPPHNIEAEQAVIGAVFLEAEAFSTAAERLTSKDFFRASHQVIFQAMYELFEKGEPIDLVSVTILLTNKGDIDVACGVVYLTIVSEYVLIAV